MIVTEYKRNYGEYTVEINEYQEDHREKYGDIMVYWGEWDEAYGSPSQLIDWSETVSALIIKNEVDPVADGWNDRKGQIICYENAVKEIESVWFRGNVNLHIRSIAATLYDDGWRTSTPADERKKELKKIYDEDDMIECEYCFEEYVKMQYLYIEYFEERDLNG